MKKSLCESCKYAVWEGKDYCSGFGGCTLPEYVCDCNNKNIEPPDDLDEVYDCKGYTPQNKMY